MKKNPEVTFAPLVLDFFNLKRQISPKALENGGYLFGHLHKNKQSIHIGIVTEAIKPIIQERYRFQFDVKDAQQQSDHIMRDYNVYFIGD